MEKYKEIVEHYTDSREKGSLIGLLQEVHSEEGYLSKEAITYISDKLNIHLNQLYSIVTFYSSFRLKPVGKHFIRTCDGTACHVHGAPAIIDTLEIELGTKIGETTDDGNFTLDTVKCLGACALAPIVTIDGRYFSKVNQKQIKKIVDDFKQMIRETEAEIS